MYPLLLEELVNNNGWLTQSELIDLFAFAQMTPGPVATNSATYVGYKIAGLPGAAVATVGVSLPSMLIMLAFIGIVVSCGQAVWLKSVLAGLRPVVVALILGAAVIIGMESITGGLGILLAAASIVASTRLKLNPALIIFIAGFIGILVSR